MTDAPRRVALADLKIYLEQSGWRRLPSRESRWTTYKLVAEGAQGVELLLPADAGYQDSAERIQDALAALSQIENRDQVSVERDLLSVNADSIAIARAAELLKEIARLHDRIKDLERDVEFLSLPAQRTWSDYEPDGMHHNKPQKRPQNCGTGYCSCIECVMKPAQRTWVSLTDEEISEIAINNPPMAHELARAIETKLKEKNT